MQFISDISKFSPSSATYLGQYSVTELYFSPHNYNYTKNHQKTCFAYFQHFTQNISRNIFSNDYHISLGKEG